MLEEIKLLKGITDNIQDGLLLLCIKDSRERILSFMNVYRSEPLENIPPDLTYILRDVATKRFNRLNAEGADKTSEEGTSFDWQSSYLDEYKDILASYTDKQEHTAKGIARFI